MANFHIKLDIKNWTQNMGHRETLEAEIKDSGHMPALPKTNHTQQIYYAPIRINFILACCAAFNRFLKLLLPVNPNRNWRGGGKLSQCDIKITEQCLCSHHYKTALKKSLFDTDLVMT